MDNLFLDRKFKISAYLTLTAEPASSSTMCADVYANYLPLVLADFSGSVLQVSHGDLREDCSCSR